MHATMLIMPFNFQKKYHNVIYHTIKYILHVLYILYYSLRKSRKYAYPHDVEQHLCHRLLVTFRRAVNTQLYKPVGGHRKRREH